MPLHLRIARPVTNLERTVHMYCMGLALDIIGHFEDHQRFDGAMLGKPGEQYHFEFTHCRNHPIVPATTEEDLAVFYFPMEEEWSAACARMHLAGFKTANSFNPYWDVKGKTFVDPDGYRVVLQNASWSNGDSKLQN